MEKFKDVFNALHEYRIECRAGDDAFYVDLTYPRTDKNYKVVEIGLCDVRAADNIRIEYDFERDGYKISQHPYIEHEQWSEDTGNWEEVGFIKAWQLRRDK